MRVLQKDGRPEPPAGDGPPRHDRGACQDTLNLEGAPRLPGENGYSHQRNTSPTTAPEVSNGTNR